MKGGEKKNFAWENFDHSMLLSCLKHQLIKISMTCVYIKPKVNKSDTTALECTPSLDIRNFKLKTQGIRFGMI